MLLRNLDLKAAGQGIGKIEIWILVGLCVSKLVVKEGERESETEIHREKRYSKIER